MARSNNRKLIPEAKDAIQQMKYEIAAEFGLPVGYGGGGFGDTEFAGELGAFGEGASRSSYWGHLTSRENGSVGGEITKRLVAQAEKQSLL
ncbi:alpha/beta-type small acid-soluble spore protein [Paenibacillus physcomitrellae]|uniref:Acid-soluble spore protein n=1 Tax=Paenibacillus physcomitrellae TaxID=1619311 RepID=A0ABQ1GHC3_9BACL|nr:alpha/beta-type small acid-soluble spore protein [Paenibacillus physcomitrellae]GGA43808.1 acid-soluble spore protein [Paenibacillus physcomitrellae]